MGLLGYMPSLGNKREMRSGQIVHEQQSVRKKNNTTTKMSDKELGTARQKKRQQTGALAPEEMRTGSD
jgi:hypothetical protein